MATPRTLVQRIALDGGKEIKQELEQLGREGKAAFEKLERAAANIDKSGGRISTFFRGVRSGFSAILRDANTVQDQLGKVGSARGGVARNSAIFGAALGVVAAGIGKVVQSTLDEADAHDEAASAIGLNVNEYGRLVSAFGKAGVGADKLKSALGILNKNIAKAVADPKSDIAETFRELGVRLKDAEGNLRPMPKIFLDIAGAVHEMDAAGKGAKTGFDSLSKSEQEHVVRIREMQRIYAFQGRQFKLTEDETRLLGIALGELTHESVIAAKAQKVFGRAGADLLPGLKEGTAGLNKMMQTAERLGVAFQPDMATRLIAAKDAIDLVGDALKGIRNVAVAAVAPALTVVSDKLVDMLVNVRPRIQEIAEKFASQLVPAVEAAIRILEGRPTDGISPVIDTIHQKVLNIGEAMQLTFKIWSATWDLMRQSVQNVLDPINLLFSTEFQANMVIALAFFLQLTGILRLVASIVRLVVSGVALLFAGFAGAPASAVIALLVTLALLLGAIRKWFPEISAAAALAWEAVSGGFLITVELIQIAWTALIAWLAEAWEALVSAAQAVGQAISNAFWFAFDTIREAFNSVVGWIKGLFDSLKQFVAGVIDWIAGKIKSMVDAVKAAAAAVASLFGAAEGGSAEGAATGGAFAGGGKVRGAGSGTSDSILAWLSNGEFVQRAKAVRYYGTDFMSKLNRLQIPRNAFGGFAQGGLAMMAALSPNYYGPRIAENGGSASGSGLRAVNLHIDGTTFSGLLATEQVAEQIVRYAGQKSVRQAGRKPSWYR